MPRNYVRKTTRQNWSEISMNNALDAVKLGMPYKTASKKFSVPIMSLKRRATGKNIHAIGGSKGLGSRRQVFSQEEELELCEHIKAMEARMNRIRNKDICFLAYQLAERNNIKHPFSAETGEAGKDWLRGFRTRHPNITKRASEQSTSATGVQAFNKPVVDKVYSILQNVKEKLPLSPQFIYNLDETSLNTVPTNSTKDFAEEYGNQVASTTPERECEEMEILEEECPSVDPKLTLLLQIFYHYSAINELMDEILKNGPLQKKDLNECINAFNEIVKKRMRTTPSEERKYKIKLRNASATLDKSITEIEPLKSALDEQRRVHSVFVNETWKEITECETAIKDSQTKHDETVKKIVSDSESEMVARYLEIREKQKTLKNKIETYREGYTKCLEECTNREKILQDAHSKSEKQLMSSLMNYDTDIAAFHQMKNNLSADLDNLIMEYKNLREAHNKQAISYATLKEEKEEAIMKAFAEKMENFSKNRAAKVIQRTWRDYRVRMLAKKKKKSKKGKTPRR